MNFQSRYKNVKVIAIDADDTLWDCQSQFDKVELEYTRLLENYASGRAISESLFATELANMPILGYGTKAFTLSLIENAVRVSDGKVGGEAIGRIVELGKTLLKFPTTPLPGVKDTLLKMADLRRQKPLRVVVFTKGELQDQENKLRRSGLWDLFDDIIVVADKTEAEYRNLAARYGVSPAELVMVGNSFKSDIAPALRIGALAMHIPYHVVWKMEHAEPFEHPNLRPIRHFSEILQLFE